MSTTLMLSSQIFKTKRKRIPIFQGLLHDEMRGPYQVLGIARIIIRANLCLIHIPMVFYPRKYNYTQWATVHIS